MKSYSMRACPGSPCRPALPASCSSMRRLSCVGGRHQPSSKDEGRKEAHTPHIPECRSPECLSRSRGDLRRHVPPRRTFKSQGGRVNTVYIVWEHVTRATYRLGVPSKQREEELAHDHSCSHSQSTTVAATSCSEGLASGPSRSDGAGTSLTRGHQHHLCPPPLTPSSPHPAHCCSSHSHSSSAVLAVNAWPGGTTSASACTSASPLLSLLSASLPAGDLAPKPPALRSSASDATSVAMGATQTVNSSSSILSVSYFTLHTTEAVKLVREMWPEGARRVCQGEHTR